MTAFSVGLEGKKPEYVVKKLFEKIVKDFLDLIILAKLHEEPAGLSGYDLISYIQVRYGFLISSGTVYSLLYTLERYRLIEGLWFERKRVYKLTPKGNGVFVAALASQDKVKGLLGLIFSPEKTEGC